MDTCDNFKDEDEAIKITHKECFIDNRWIQYTACSQNKDNYSDIKDKQYLGESAFCKIDGIELPGRKLYHYWYW